MNSILKNASSFLTILETAHLPRVRSWEEKDLKLALDWATYHQKLYDKYHADKRARPFLNTELRKLSYRCCVLIDTFCFDFLQNCRDFLLNTLSNNPNLNYALKCQVSKLYSKPVVTVVPLFKCSLLHTGSGSITSRIRQVISDTVEFYKSANKTTEAPLRAVKNLLSRVSVDTHHQTEPYQNVLQIFVESSQEVQGHMIDWMSVSADRSIWLHSNTRLLAMCSAVNPSFLKLHLQHIMALFSDTYCIKNRHNAKSKTSSSIAGSKPSDLIFECKDINHEDGITELLKHVVILDAADNNVQLIIRTMLGTLSKHAKYGNLSSCILDFITLSTSNVIS